MGQITTIHTTTLFIPFPRCLRTGKRPITCSRESQVFQLLIRRLPFLRPPPLSSLPFFLPPFFLPSPLHLSFLIYIYRPPPRFHPFFLSSLLFDLHSSLPPSLLSTFSPPFHPSFFPPSSISSLLLFLPFSMRSLFLPILVYSPSFPFFLTPYLFTSSSSSFPFLSSLVLIYLSFSILSFSSFFSFPHLSLFLYFSPFLPSSLLFFFFFIILSPFPYLPYFFPHFLLT